MRLCDELHSSHGTNSRLYRKNWRWWLSAAIRLHTFPIGSDRPSPKLNCSQKLPRVGAKQWGCSVAVLLVGCCSWIMMVSRAISSSKPFPVYRWLKHCLKPLALPPADLDAISSSTRLGRLFGLDSELFPSQKQLLTSARNYKLWSLLS